MEVLPYDVMVVNGAGDRVYDGQNYTLYVGTSQPDGISMSLTGKTPLSKNIKFL